MNTSKYLNVSLTNVTGWRALANIVCLIDSIDFNQPTYCIFPTGVTALV